MKKRRFLILLLMVGLILAVAPSIVWARGSDSPQGGSIIETDKQAKGTKLSGPLTIYYDILEGTTADMYFFMRLRKGQTLYIFGGMESISNYQNITLIQEKIEDFVGATVIPSLFGLTVTYWALKSVEQVIEPDDPAATEGCCGGMLFTIMDIVIAVDD